MRLEPFPIQAPAPQLLGQQHAHLQPAEQWQGHANPLEGLPPPPATLMAGKPIPIPPPSPNSWRTLILHMATAITSPSTSTTTNITTSIMSPRWRLFGGHRHG